MASAGGGAGARDIWGSSTPGEARDGDTDGGYVLVVCVESGEVWMGVDNGVYATVKISRQSGGYRLVEGGVNAIAVFLRRRRGQQAK